MVPCGGVAFRCQDTGINGGVNGKIPRLSRARNPFVQKSIVPPAAIQPSLSLDDLATDWLPRRLTQLAAMPGLNNDLGSIQVEADIAAIKHPVFPPYSGGNEVTWLTLLNGRQLAQQTERVEIRWRAFEVERKCHADGWEMKSRTSLLPEDPGAQVQVTITNTKSSLRSLKVGFLCSGRAMNSGPEGYAWAVPSIPTDVFSFTKTDGLAQTVSEIGIPGAICISNEGSTAHAVHAAWPAPDRWERERIPTWDLKIAAGESVTITLLASFHAEKEEAIRIAREWMGRDGEVFALARRRWENLWSAVFTPGNPLFSGHLPLLESPNEAMLKLYYNAVLTILTCRRIYKHAVVKPAYVTLWPRRGEGSNYLAWELNCTSGILARLDPEALRSHWLLLASAPWLDYQVTNYFNGEHGGWACSAQPQSIYTAAFNLVRWPGDKSWLDQSILRKPKSARGFEAASQGQVQDASGPQAFELTGRDAFLQAVHVHRDHYLPGKATVDYGGRAAYLECISTYAHGTAGHTALQAWALRHAAPVSGENPTAEIEALENAVRDLYSARSGYFDCEYPDGSRRPAANLYDMGLVLRHAGHCLSAQTIREIVAFARSELLTPTWAHCLWPGDVDVASGIRCDHQWAGCFSAWPAQFVLGLLQAGERGSWIAEWLEGVSKVTRQGPFAQAYWAEDVYPPEAGAAAKCYDELTQGNHWVIGSGVLFAEMILDGVCGLQADWDGNLTVRAGLDEWTTDACLSNVTAHGKTFTLRKGKLERSA